MGPAQLAEVLGRLPRNANPSLLVGFETSDDAGVFLLPNGQALVQTMDFFTPIVDDPFSYGQIAAANALSDVYAMGGKPLTAMNIACFDPEAAPAQVWADIFLGMSEKTTESGAALVGGHTVVDDEPKFGMSVTGLIDPALAWRNDQAKVGDQIWLSKPLGTGIVTTAAKADKCSPEELSAAVDSMTTLNRVVCEAAVEQGGVRCATDITGFSLAGHLFNVARASKVSIRIEASTLPILPGVEHMVEADCLTGGGAKNRLHLADRLVFGPLVKLWLQHVVVDPQTSGGLALFSTRPIPGCVRIGEVVTGDPTIFVD